MFGFEREQAEQALIKGLELSSQGQFAAALRELREALEIFDRLGDAKAKANCLNKVGNLHCNRENFSESLAYFQEGLAIEEKLGDDYAIATAMVNIAGILEKLKRDHEAVKCYDAALVIMGSLPSTLGNTFLVDAARVGLRRLRT